MGMKQQAEEADRSEHRPASRNYGLLRLVLQLDEGYCRYCTDIGFIPGAEKMGERQSWHTLSYTDR
jgi:NADH:ubiquinone oxidoreductase subunit D